MTTPHTLRAVSLAALVMLAACKEQTIVADTTGDDMQAELNAAKPVELPPAMTASKSYRCKDGSVAYIDFFSGDKQAILHSGKRENSVVLKAEEAGKPFTAAGGYSLTGTGATITLAQPGRASQSCKA